MVRDATIPVWSSNEQRFKTRTTLRLRAWHSKCAAFGRPPWPYQRSTPSAARVPAALRTKAPRACIPFRHRHRVTCGMDKWVQAGRFSIKRAGHF